MKSRVLLITGAGGKVGLLLVSHFLSAGDTVIATCRTAASLKTIRSKYSDYGDSFVAIQSDLMVTDSAKVLHEKLSRMALFPDCIINNARSQNFLKIEKNGEITRENFANEYILDVIVPYELVSVFAGCSSNTLRRVVNIGSQYGLVAANPSLYDDPVQQSPINYSVAKAGVVHLTKELGVRLAGKGIQVNCVAYGGVEGRVGTSFKQRYGELCPQGRMLSEGEIAGPVDMLLSEKCSGMTGHTVVVDGGWSVL